MTARVSLSVAAAAALLACASVLAAASKKAAPPPLPQEIRHPSGAFSFRTPANWGARAAEGASDVLEAGGDGLLVRFLFKPQEIGLDALHATCLDIKLLGPMDTSLQVKYEYDFVGGEIGNRRVLDSACEVSYYRPVLGATEWRQRTVTVVGEGESLCAISYAPRALWKKSKETRALLDAILASVAFSK